MDGFKRDEYIKNIATLINNGHKNCIPIIDNYEEIDTETLQKYLEHTIQFGIINHCNLFYFWQIVYQDRK